ncbi:MAG: SDR family oxidoreductase [Desulfohalobiaceae bacterium]
MQLAGSTALITGASRGLGRACALAMASAGANLVLVARSRQELENTAQEARSQGVRALALAVDLEDTGQARQDVQSALQDNGPVDILVNNAAVIGPARFLEDQQDCSRWQRTLQINLQAAACLIHELLPGMLEKGRGRVINVVSGLASMAFPRFSAYCASKAGLLQLTRCLSQEYQGRGVQFVGLDPGVLDTDMQAGIRSLDSRQLGPLRRQFMELKEQGQLRAPQEVAKLVLALAKRDSEQDSGRVFAMRDLPDLQQA